MSKAVICIAKTQVQAETLVTRLEGAGVSTSDISVLMPDRSGSRDFAHEHHTKAPEGATIGGSAGGVTGGVLGLLAGIGALAIPGVGPFIAAGPIMAALSARAIEAGFFQEEIGRSAYEYQLSVEQGSTVIVGVNRFTDGEASPIIPTPNFAELEAGQLSRLAAVRAARDGDAVERALRAIREVAPAYLGGTAAVPPLMPPLMPLIIDAVRARASVGEISDVLRGVWGEYRPG